MNNYNENIKTIDSEIYKNSSNKIERVNKNVNLQIEYILKLIQNFKYYKDILKLYKLEEEEFLKLIYFFILKDYKENDIIFDINEEIVNWYFLLNGKIIFMKKEDDNKYIQIGEAIDETFFGEKEFIISNKSSTRAIARADSKIIILSKQILRGKIMSHLILHCNSIQRIFENIFNLYSEDFIKNLISLLFFKYYKKNEVLYDENLYSEHIFILYQGNFLLEKLINNKKRIICQISGKGMIIGCESLYKYISNNSQNLNERKYKYSLKCDSEIGICFKFKFTDYFNLNNKGKKTIIKILSDFQSFYNKIEEISKNLETNIKKNYIIYNEFKMSLILNKESEKKINWKYEKYLNNIIKYQIENKTQSKNNLKRENDIKRIEIKKRKDNKVEKNFKHQKNDHIDQKDKYLLKFSLSLNRWNFKEKGYNSGNMTFPLISNSCK